MQDAFGHPQRLVVLGGTSDIARAVAARLCRERVRTVVLAGRSASLLAAAADELTRGRRDGSPPSSSTPTSLTRPPDTVASCLEAAGARWTSSSWPWARSATRRRTRTTPRARSTT